MLSTRSSSSRPATSSRLQSSAPACGSSISTGSRRPAGPSCWSSTWATCCPRARRPWVSRSRRHLPRRPYPCWPRKPDLKRAMPASEPDLLELPLHAALDDALFARFRDLIYREAGIALTDMKKALLVGRLAGRLRELRLTSLAAYYAIVADPANVEERRRMLDRIATNETQFFRDGRQFTFLEETVYPALEAASVAGGPRRMRAWSAPCSTGEEPYSIAMSLLARFPA